MCSFFLFFWVVSLVRGVWGGGAEAMQVALAHYPSLEHFADMIASEDYQDVNMRYRVPSLRDTCILCTSEVEIEGYSEKSKL